MPLSHHTFFFFFFIYFSLSNFLLFSFTHHDHKFEGNNVRITNRNFTHSITNFTRSHHITLLHNFFLHQTAQFKNQENKSHFLNLLYSLRPKKNDVLGFKICPKKNDVLLNLACLRVHVGMQQSIST
jgi:hypothetical protein